jgi:hypothetical protein
VGKSAVEESDFDHFSVSSIQLLKMTTLCVPNTKYGRKTIETVLRENLISILNSVRHRNRNAKSANCGLTIVATVKYSEAVLESPSWNRIRKRYKNGTAKAITLPLSVLLIVPRLKSATSIHNRNENASLSLKYECKIGNNIASRRTDK